MPIYRYKLANGELRDEFQHIHDPPLASIEGQSCERVPVLTSVQTQYGEGNACEPIKMLSIALDHEVEIDEFRKRNPGVEISRDRRNPDFGVPVARSSSDKKRILKREGFQSMNDYG